MPFGGRKACADHGGVQGGGNLADSAAHSGNKPISHDDIAFYIAVGCSPWQNGSVERKTFPGLDDDAVDSGCGQEHVDRPRSVWIVGGGIAADQRAGGISHGSGVRRGHGIGSSRGRRNAGDCVPSLGFSGCFIMKADGIKVISKGGLQIRIVIPVDQAVKFRAARPAFRQAEIEIMAV